MNCPNCGKPSASAFCPDCGTPLQAAHSAPSTSPASEPSGEDGVNLFQIIPGWIWATAAILILVVVLFARSVGSGTGTSNGQSDSSSSRPSYTAAQLDAMFTNASPFLPALHEIAPTHYKGKPVYITGKVVEIGNIDSTYFTATIATKGTTDQPDEYVSEYVDVLFPFTIPGAVFQKGDVITAYGYVTDAWTETFDFPVIDTYRITKASSAPTSSANTVTSTPTSSTIPSVKKYPAGMYKVGTDIPAGLYVLTAGTSYSGYYKVTSDSSGSFDSILYNENFNGRCYLELKNGQYVELTRCTAISFDDAEPLSPTGGTLSGNWLKVGFDIAPGEYKITAVSGTGYCAVYSHATTDFANIMTNDNFTGSKYITVKAGQYLQLSQCELAVN